MQNGKGLLNLNVNESCFFWERLVEITELNHSDRKIHNKKAKRLIFSLISNRAYIQIYLKLISTIHDDHVNKLLVHVCVKSLNGIIRSKHLSYSFYSHGIQH